MTFKLNRNPDVNEWPEVPLARIACAMHLPLGFVHEADTLAGDLFKQVEGDGWVSCAYTGAAVELYVCKVRDFNPAEVKRAANAWAAQVALLLYG